MILREENQSIGREIFSSATFPTTIPHGGAWEYNNKNNNINNNLC